MDVIGSRVLGRAVIALGAAHCACDWEELDALAPLGGDSGGETDELVFTTDAPPGSDVSHDESDGSRLLGGDAQREDSTLATDVMGGTDVSDGAPGEASTSGLACATASSPATAQWTFDTTIEGWALLSGSSDATLTWTGAGNPEPGALEVDGTASPTDGASTIPAYAVVNETPSVDLGGHTVSAWLWLDSGTSPSIKLFVQTGSLYVWADGGSIVLSPLTWTCVTLDVSSPAYYSQDGVYDPTSVVRIGFELDQSAPYRLYIDSVGY
ncbi:MAG: hypothetical protein ABTD50_18380 [Polyangiaceae bacterium]